MTIRTATAIAADAKKLVQEAESSGRLKDYPGYADAIADAVDAIAATCLPGADADDLLFAALTSSVDLYDSPAACPAAVDALIGANLSIAAAAAPVSIYAAAAVARAPVCRLTAALTAA